MVPEVPRVTIDMSAAGSMTAQCGVAPETLPETVTALTADARGARPAHVGAIKAMIG